MSEKRFSRSIKNILFSIIFQKSDAQIFTSLSLKISWYIQQPENRQTLLVPTFI